MPFMQASSKCNCTVEVRCHPSAVITKMEALGARVVTRFSKDVTHIIFQKHAKTANAEQREAEAAELRALYDKIEKVHLPPVRLGGLSPAWPGWHVRAGCVCSFSPGHSRGHRVLFDMIDSWQLRVLCVTIATPRSFQL